MTEEITVRLSVEEAERTVAELDAMGHSKPGEHEGPVDERCPTCDFLDRLRSALASQPEHSEEAGELEPCRRCGSLKCAEEREAGLDILEEMDDEDDTPSPEPGTEVAERLAAVERLGAWFIENISSDMPMVTDEGFHRMASEAIRATGLARPMLSEEQRERLKLIGDRLASIPPYPGDLTGHADAAFLWTLAAKPDQENPDA